MTKSAAVALRIAHDIQDAVPRRGIPPDVGLPAETQYVVPASVFHHTRSYIEAIVNQINGAYEHGCYDACAVMIRRLIETLIIEAFEGNGLAQNIQDASGNFYGFDELINKTISEPTWNLSRNTKNALPKLRANGNLSAHSRRYMAHRRDIDALMLDLRVVTQELVYLAKF